MPSEYESRVNNSFDSLVSITTQTPYTSDSDAIMMGAVSKGKQKTNNLIVLPSMLSPLRVLRRFPGVIDAIPRGRNTREWLQIYDHFLDVYTAERLKNLNVGNRCPKDSWYAFRES